MEHLSSAAQAAGCDDASFRDLGPEERTSPHQCIARILALGDRGNAETVGKLGG
jgi:hypothetical protein